MWQNLAPHGLLLCLILEVEIMIFFFERIFSLLKKETIATNELNVISRLEDEEIVKTKSKGMCPAQLNHSPFLLLLLFFQSHSPKDIKVIWKIHSIKFFTTKMAFHSIPPYNKSINYYKDILLCAKSAKIKPIRDKFDEHVTKTSHFHKKIPLSIMENRSFFFTGSPKSSN